MNLLALRELFVKQTGRYDLVVDTTNWVDNGADIYINQGQKWLDRQFRFPKDTASYFPTLTSGQWFVTIPLSRAIKEVWALTTSARTIVHKVDHVAAKEYYSTPPANMDTGIPKFYWPTNIRQVPDPLNPQYDTTAPPTTTSAPTTAAPSTSSPEDLFETMLENTNYHEYNGLVIMPPPSAGYMLEVVGLFYTPPLNNESAETFWSSEHPLVLVMAAARQMEVMHRNTSGVRDWEAAIQSELVSLDMDGVEQEIAELDQMVD